MLALMPAPSFATMADVKPEATPDERQRRDTAAIPHPIRIAAELPSAPMTAFRPPAYDAQHMPTFQAMPPLRVQTVPKLPSFATLDNAARDEPAGRRGFLSATFREPVSTRPPPSSTILSSPPVDHFGGSNCTCSQMKPMVATAGQLVRRLNDVLQRRVLDAEYDEFLGPLSTSLQSMQWIVEQLTSIETHLHCTRDAAFGHRLHENSPVNKRSATNDPSTFFERPLTPSKRARRDSGSAYTNRAGSPTFSHKRSSPHSDGRGGHTDLRQPQPQSTSTLTTRLLPSPLSSTLPPYSASVQRTQKGSSASPAPASSASGPSLHNAPVTSAASEYIADLQHQVTLKSLALQSLQTEHTNLLQRMHRENVKFQAIEKKSHVADQEINDLLTKNDELVEQIRTLTLQVTDIERRREDQTQAAAREKEQWSRMLDMSGRLQLKAEEDRRRLQEDNTRLSEQMGDLELQILARFRRDITLPPRTVDHSTAKAVCDEEDQPDAQDQPRSSTTPMSGPKEEPAAVSSSSPSSSTMVPAKAIEVYQSQIDLLRNTLEKVVRQNLDMSDKARELQDLRDGLMSAVGIALRARAGDKSEPNVID